MLQCSKSDAKAVLKARWRQGWVLAGFPKTSEEAQKLRQDEMLCPRRVIAIGSLGSMLEARLPELVFTSCSFVLHQFPMNFRRFPSTFHQFSRCCVDPGL